MMSGGTEGVLSPHFTVFTRSFVDAVPAHESMAMTAASLTS